MATLRPAAEWREIIQEACRKGKTAFADEGVYVIGDQRFLPWNRPAALNYVNSLPEVTEPAEAPLEE